MRFRLPARSIAFLALVSASSAWAVPTPAKPFETVEPGMPEITLRVDFRNLTGDGDKGRVAELELTRRLDDTNRIWALCGIKFLARTVKNVSAAVLKVPYEPKSQGDLSLIAGALNPSGFDGAIPLTVAGPWNFYDAGSGVYLHGLGWVFVSGGPKIDRIGAMISNTKVADPHAGALLGHELGHALSLGHSAAADNVMAGGDKLDIEQCRQARRFSETALAEFVAPKPEIRASLPTRSSPVN